MIDLHVHTEYSKHATGTVRAVVESAIDKGISILAVTDHAPFPIDRSNRLLEDELVTYSQEVDAAKIEYVDKIKVLKGLEVDFLRKYKSNFQKVLTEINADYIIGAIHYIFFNGEKVNVWDIERTGSQDVLEVYMEELRSLVRSGLVDAIAHPDILLRGGLDERVLYDAFSPILDEFVDRGVCYELNCSGFTKPSYDLTSRERRNGIRTFPSKLIMAKLKEKEIPFTVGSDSHSVDFVGKNIRELLTECKELGLLNAVYFEDRQMRKFSF